MIKTVKVTPNRQLLINIAASAISFSITLGINFLLSPYIVENVGEDAYGFVQLSNNFISYFSILTIALNSMSSRFISISYFRNDILEANKYFSSTFFSNLFISIISLPILLILVAKINIFIQVPIELLSDIQLLIIFMIINFIISLLSTNLGISYYVKNRLYLSSIISSIGYIIRAALLFVLFNFFKPSIVYIGLVTVIVTCFTQLINIHYKRIMISELKIKVKYFDINKIKEMIFSGIWNTITRLGSLLSEGLDLLITNIFISATDMGVLAIAKIIPNMINNILNTLINTFMPSLTELYAKEKYNELVDNVKKSMKIIGMIINIPIAILIAYGDIFFSLWFPTQNAKLLQNLSILTVLPWAIMGQVTIIHNIFTIVNKIKINSILVCVTGLLNVIVVFILLHTTNLGLFAVAGVSAVLGIIRNLLYTVPFGAIYIKCKWYTFFPEIFKSVVSVFSIAIIGCVLKLAIVKHSWISLITFASLTSLIGVLFNYYLVLNKEDRKFVTNIILRKIKK